MFVHIILSSVLVAEWPLLGKSCSLRHMFSLKFDYLLYSLFPVRDVGSDFGVSGLCIDGVSPSVFRCTSMGVQRGTEVKWKCRLAS